MGAEDPKKIDIIQGIHSTNDYERRLFGAVRAPFNSHLNRWQNLSCPDRVDHNFFEAPLELTVSDIQAAISAQKRRALNYVMIRMDRPMEPLCRSSFAFEETATHVMAMQNPKNNLWPINTDSEIRDIQSSDIRADLLDVSSVPEPYREVSYRNMQMVLEVAKTHPEYHWLCAYADGKRVGNVYALSHNGFVEMDDLWVEEDYRHHRVATTMMKYIADRIDGVLYLHADTASSPKDMYAKMGFEVVETVYEYDLEW